MKKRKLESYQEPLSQNHVVNLACLICLMLTWIGWPSDIDSVHEGNKSKKKVFALTLAFVVLTTCFKIAPKKQGNQGCREQTMGSWRARLSWTHLGRLSLQFGTDKSGSPTHLLTFLSQAGTLPRHRSNVLQRCMTATASLRESLTLRSTIHLMIFRKEKVQTSLLVFFAVIQFQSGGGVHSE